jgi:hypothetical protein
MKGKIFTAQEVQALIAGNKTQFREVIKKPAYTSIGGTHVSSRYIKGSEIFVKEAFEIWDDGIVYRASNLACDPVAKWKPAQHMKQEHSRLTLQIIEIRVERLQDISEEDAIAEGNYLDRCACLPRKKDKSPIDAMFKQNWCHIHGQEFKDAWNATHKKPEEKFEANPWVFVYTMEVVK